MTKTSTLSREAQKIMSSFVENKERKIILRLMFNWLDVVGNNIAAYSFPKRLKNTHGKGLVLMIEVANSSIGTEIYYMKKEIIARANAFLGISEITNLVLASNYQAVAIKTELSNQDVKAITLQNEEKKLCDVGDQSLSDSLVDLLKAIKTK